MADTATSPPAAPPEAGVKPGWTRFAPLLIFLLVLAGIVWALQRGGVRHELQNAMVGRPVPAFSLPPLDGAAPITPASFAGKAYVVNFFASDCAACKVEHPMMNDLAKAGVPILGIVYKDEAGPVRAYLADLGNPYQTVGFDPDGRFALELGVAATPETFVVGADGVVKAMHRGGLNPDELSNKILPALNLK
jgi:cytochrome c biogenesis protein CcmG/thiol:disulfide interchange protein DsbE